MMPPAPRSLVDWSACRRSGSVPMSKRRFTYILPQVAACLPVLDHVVSPPRALRRPRFDGAVCYGALID